MSVIQVRRGDIHYANLDPVVGRETGKTRPVFVIQNDIGNMHSPYYNCGRNYRIFREKSIISHLRCHQEGEWS